MQSLIKFQKPFLHNRNADLQIHTELQEALISQRILKKNKITGLKLLDFETYCKAAVIQTVWYWHKDRKYEIK